MRRPNVRAPRVFQRTASETSTSDRTAPPTSPLSDTTPAQAPAPATRESTAQDLVDPFPAKLAREHAHHRQRTLRAADRARPKLAVPRSASIDRTRSRSKLRPLDGEEGDGGDGGEGVFWADVWADGVVYEGARYEREGVKEVRLVDLIRPPRVSKNKVALRVSRESDFEIVPHVRSVIVLDDFDSAEGPEGVDFDHDAWEYVSSAGGDDEVKAVLSYAEVVARKAT